MVYVGSKNKIAKYILPYIHKSLKATKYNNYIEPFVGGANIIDKVKAKNKIGSDKNKYLIALFNKLKKNEINIPKYISKKEYELVKNYKHYYPDWYIGLVGHLASWAGMFFSQYIGDNPNRNYYKESVNNILNQLDDLRDITFINCNYTNWSDIKDSVIYCDPPYKGMKIYRHIDGISNYEEFYEFCKYIGKNNVVLISEYNMPNEFKLLETIKEKEKLFTIGLGIDILGR